MDLEKIEVDGKTKFEMILTKLGKLDFKYTNFTRASKFPSLSLFKKM